MGAEYRSIKAFILSRHKEQKEEENKAIKVQVFLGQARDQPVEVGAHHPAARRRRSCPRTSASAAAVHVLALIVVLVLVIAIVHVAPAPTPAAIAVPRRGDP